MATHQPRMCNKQIPQTINIKIILNHCKMTDNQQKSLQMLTIMAITQ